MERWARRTAWQAWNRAAAASLFRRQLLLDLFQPCALLETAHAVHHPWRHVCPDTGLPAIGIDGKNVGSATKSADHHPATVMAEGDILYLENREVKWKCSHQRKWRACFKRQICTGNVNKKTKCFFFPHKYQVNLAAEHPVPNLMYLAKYSVFFSYKQAWTHHNKPGCKALHTATRAWHNFQIEFTSKKNWEIISITCFVICFLTLNFRNYPGGKREGKKEGWEQEREHIWARLWQILAPKTVLKVKRKTISYMPRNLANQKSMPSIFQSCLQWSPAALSLSISGSIIHSAILGLNAVLRF